MENFCKDVPSIKLVSTTICKIVTEMWFVVSPRSYAVRSPPRARQQGTVKSLLLLSTLVQIFLYNGSLEDSEMLADRKEKRWLIDVKTDLGVLGVKIWRIKALDRIEWFTVLRKTKAKLQGL